MRSLLSCLALPFGASPNSGLSPKSPLAAQGLTSLMSELAGKAGYERLIFLRMKAAEEYAAAAVAMEQQLAIEFLGPAEPKESPPVPPPGPMLPLAVPVADPDKADKSPVPNNPVAKTDPALLGALPKSAPTDRTAKVTRRRSRSRRTSKAKAAQKEWDSWASATLWGMIRRGRLHEGKKLPVAKDGSACLIEAAAVLDVEPGDLAVALETFQGGWELATQGNECRLRARGDYHDPSVSSVFLELPIQCWKQAQPWGWAMRALKAQSAEQDDLATPADPNAGATSATASASGSASGSAAGSAKAAGDPNAEQASGEPKPSAPTTPKEVLKKATTGQGDEEEESWETWGAITKAADRAWSRNVRGDQQGYWKWR